MAVRIGGLDHVVLRTTKRDEVLAFYRDKLGCPVERTLEMIGLYQLRAGSALIDVLDTTVFTVAAAGPGESLYDHFCVAIAADSVDEVLALLDARGIPHGDPAQRYGATGDGTSIYATDPDGRTVELKITGGDAAPRTA
ncbi:VOC family protein [Candidatus Binatia bacterium]|nr:VOC family protein [Candidatus Binatia bacterium]